MEFRQLRYFIGVVEAGSLLQASTRLHVAQPALGQQIAALEHGLGAQLFERSSRGMSLTEAGRIFLEHARVVLADADRAREAVRSSKAAPSGAVSLGLPTTVGLVATVPLLSACRERYPQIRLRVVEGYSGFLREWLQAGRLDLSLLYGDAIDAALAKRPLLDDRLALVTSAAGKAPPRRPTLHDLARWPLVLPGPDHGLRRIIDDACGPLGIALDVVAEIESLSSVKRAVEAGLGATILPKGSVAEEIAAGRLRASDIASPGMSRRVVCATSVTRPGTTAGTAVMNLVSEVLRQMVDDGSWPARWIGGKTG
ncbi:Transcriptional regulator [Rubrivivax sp. A210]|uniref:LysR family transcriptional regulator n=1 Tax=Rubrivivax sp. A210 TaxID=2772301 RepID=UPI00191A64C3|nr:LysR substrate-binding domain-containing protein [Rubrivivax sp. A210]CAD5367168.1 Transcriptional regulator [Rubrivivax sp. A210]